VTEKTAKATKQPEKPKQVQKAMKPTDKDREKPKQPNAVVRWWRETVGELRKVAWPTIAETRRLTLIVLAVMFAMSILLGSLDWLFSKLVALLIS
jgi:preprotein translocase subunit SecE